MKNTSKKSKFVILPALATLVLTSVATVTSTAAWFTAARTTSVNANNFIAYDENKGLVISAKEVAGCDISEDGKTVEPNGVLTDASFDFANVWTDLPTDELDEKGNPAQPSEFKKVTDTSLKSGAIDSNRKEVFYAVKWTYTIKLSSQTGTLAKAVDVMFDKSSTFNFTGANTTASAFRIAMVCGTEKFVFSNNTAADEKAKNHIGEGTNDTEKGEVKVFDDSQYIITTSPYNKLTDGASHTNANEYLGTITKATDELTINCTAWYEGTDDAFVSGKTMSTVGATLKFYSRNAA